MGRARTGLIAASVLVALALGLLVVFLVLSHFIPTEASSGQTLASSLTRQVPRMPAAISCKRSAPKLATNLWTCSGLDTAEIARRRLAVATEAGGCWKARRLGPRGSGPPRDSPGCTMLIDSLRPLDRLFGALGEAREMLFDRDTD